MEQLLHTSDGVLVEIAPPPPKLKHSTQIDRVELDNEEEILAKPHFVMHLQRMRQVDDELHEDGRRYFEEKAIRQILNFYKRLKKNNCETWAGDPHFSRAGYIRGSVIYPDGRVRRWGSHDGWRWYTDK